MQKTKAHSVIDKIYYKLNLQRAWEKVKANRGSAGVDGESIREFEKNLDKNLEEIHQELKEDRYEPQPVKRVWIPKRDGKKRPLGIPTVKDRVVQQAILLRLDPIFDPVFVESSYGFRKGRSAHQALGDIAMELHKGWQWIVEVDIKGYFDNIPQERLIDFVAEQVSDGRVLKLIRKFLKAGVMEDFKKRRVTMGTPQGGVISPLLANIYLNYYDQKMKDKGYKVVRYADDFVVICSTRRGAKEALDETLKILAELELEVEPTKTGTVHITQGFEFLGFLFKKGYSLYVIPRAEAVKAFKDNLRWITRRNRPVKLPLLIREMNLLIVGWGNYFRRGKC